MNCLFITYYTTMNNVEFLLYISFTLYFFLTYAILEWFNLHFTACHTYVDISVHVMEKGSGMYRTVHITLQCAVYYLQFA